MIIAMIKKGEYIIQENDGSTVFRIRMLTIQVDKPWGFERKWIILQPTQKPYRNGKIDSVLLYNNKLV